MYFYILISIILFPILRRIRNYFRGPTYEGKKEVAKKTVIVTGSSAGLGMYTAFDLLDNGATVIFACRDEKKTLKLINSIWNSEKRSRAIFMKLDLSEIESVFEFVKQFKSKYKQLDILVNNAGFYPDTYSLTKDGIESSLQSNHLGHMALTHLLMDSFGKRDARIINVSSRGHKRSDYTVEGVKKLQSNLEFKVEENINSSRGMIIYGNSKLANVFFTQYLAEIFEKKKVNIKTASLHPGVVNTEFGRFVSTWGWKWQLLYYVIYPLLWFGTKNSLDGAQTSLSLCYMDFALFENGQYYADNQRTETYSIAKNEELRNEFIKYSWMLLDKITNGKNTIPRYN